MSHHDRHSFLRYSLSLSVQMNHRSLWLGTEVNSLPFFLQELCQPEGKDVNLGIVEEESNPNNGSTVRDSESEETAPWRCGKKRLAASLSIVPLSRWHRHLHGDYTRSLWLRPTPAISSCLPILDLQGICLDCRSSPVHISCPFPSSNLLLESLISSYVPC